MTTFYLVRHALVDTVGRSLAGRASGLSLNETGRGQAERLADWFTREPVRRIYSSPLERTQETARPIAHRLGLEPETAEELIELDFGDWTGRTLDELESDTRWRRFNAFRSGVGIPNGERMSTSRRGSSASWNACTRRTPTTPWPS
jgi:broad specificity phosphatase PhoE